MALMDAALEFLFRWIHFLAGIMWIGLLWFFNFVNTPFMRVLDPSARPLVIPTLLPRALAWFRHAAWLTVLAGFVLIWLKYWQHGDIITTPNAKTIFVGMLLGLVMVFNVWVIIWPNQKRIIEAVKAGQAPDPTWAKYATYASRTNVVLSFPLLLFMDGAGHYGLDWDYIAVLGGVAAILGFFLLFWVQKWAVAKF
jgi:uncharacterized membrane protein